MYNQTSFIRTASGPVRCVRIVKHADYWIIVNRKWLKRLPCRKCVRIVKPSIKEARTNEVWPYFPVNILFYSIYLFIHYLFIIYLFNRGIIKGSQYEADSRGFVPNVQTRPVDPNVMTFWNLKLMTENPPKNEEIIGLFMESIKFHDFFFY